MFKIPFKILDASSFDVESILFSYSLDNRDYSTAMIVIDERVVKCCKTTPFVCETSCKQNISANFAVRRRPRCFWVICNLNVRPLFFRLTLKVKIGRSKEARAKR
jgi:hypothetical protein